MTRAPQNPDELGNCNSRAIRRLTTEVTVKIEDLL